MNFRSNPFVAVLDANVLYPYRVRDVLLTFCQEGLFRPRWTNQILEEWTRSVIRTKPKFEKSIRKQESIIRRVFDDCLVTGHEPFISELDLPDRDDRHVLAAAIRCGAQVIVTENLKDFPAATLDEYDIEALTADDFLVNTYTLFRSDGARALRMVRKMYRDPPFTTAEFILDLTKSGLPKLAATARADIEFL